MSDTYVEAVQGEALVFKFGDGGGPEQFAASCSINTERSVEFISEIYTTQLANCTDPSKPSKTIRRVKSKDIKFSGAGMTDVGSFKTLLQLWEAALPINGQVLQDVTGGFQLDGPWVIENLKTGGTRGEEQAFDISLSAADEIDITYP